MKVLITDNDAQVRALLRELLRELHDDVLECADGHAALRLCETEQPDLLLMDIRMPQLNGIETTRRIIAAHPDLQVLIVTQYDDDDLRMKAREAGAHGYFLKDDLLLLQQHLRRLHGRDRYTDTDEYNHQHN